MAKGSKRQRKKIEKKRQQIVVQKYKNLPGREVQRLSTTELNRQYTAIIAEQAKQKRAAELKEKRRSVLRQNQIQYKNNVSQKRMWLIENGYSIAAATRTTKTGKQMIRNGKPVPVLSDKVINKLSFEDMRAGSVPRAKYPEFYDLDKFDFDRIYSCKNGEKLFFAFQDWSGEMRPFADLVQDYMQKSGPELLDMLEAVINMQETVHTGEGGKLTGSSGKPATYKFIAGPQPVISNFNQANITNYNRRKARPRKSKNKWAHTAYDKQPFQVLKNGRNNSYTEITARNLLAVANAILYNINERERSAFYAEFKPAVQRLLPEIGAILP